MLRHPVRFIIWYRAAGPLPCLTISVSPSCHPSDGGPSGLSVPARAALFPTIPVVHSAQPWYTVSQVIKMIRIQNIPLPIGGGMEQLKKRAARVLGVSPDTIRKLSLVRQSIDARKKNDVH